MAERLLVDPVTPGPSQRRAFRSPWLQRWMRAAHLLGNLWAWVLLTLFYVVFITPIGLIVSRRADWLRIRRRPTAWKTRLSQYDRLKDATLQS